MDTLTCKKCGEEIANDSESCPACGVQMASASCAIHPERPAEGACVVCGNELCGGCNKGGDSHYLCEAHKDIAVVNGWAQVYATPNDLDAQLIRENLEAEDIDARVISQKDHFSLPVDLGDLSQVRVFVPAYSYEEATDLLEAHMDDEGEVRFGDEEETPVA